MQLSYPWFLVCLGVIVIPIVIHLLQLRRPQRLMFTNIGFINEVKLVTAQRRKIQHLLVLISRVLGLSALVLVFCQPVIPAAHQKEVIQAGTIDVIVDNSVSMGIPAKTGNSFSAALQHAASLGSVYPSARFRLNNGGRGTTTRLVYQQKLSEIQVTNGQSALNKYEHSVLENRQGTQSYIFSDFQRSTFNPSFLKQIDPLKEVVLVPENSEKKSNIYTDSVWFDDILVRARTNTGLHIRLRNGGSLAIADCPVRVYLGSQQVAAFRVTVAGGQKVVSVVQIQVADQQLVRGRVVTEDVPVVFDNTYYFTAQATGTIRVLEIGPLPVTKVLYEDESLFNYSFTKPENVNYEALRRANLVLMREVPLVTDGLRDALRGVVARGGSVAIVPAEAQASHISYQQLFRDLGIGAPEWTSPGTPPELREVALPTAREEFFRDVLGTQPRGVAMPRVAPVLRWARTGTDILRLRDGESYLAEFTNGPGKVYAFSAPFSKEYSDFTDHALFVPVLYKLAMRSFQSEQQPAYRLTQHVVNLTLPTAPGAGGVVSDRAAFRLVRDSATWLPVQRVQGNGVRLDVPAGLEAPGFYQVWRGRQLLTTVAFNASTKESELATYSADELRALVGPGRPNVRVLEGGPGEAVGTQLQAERGGQPLWRYFLGLALACLLVEALLLRFGQPRVGMGKAAVAA